VFDEQQRAVLRLADALCGDSHALAPELIADLQALFSEGELAELILVAGQANLNNRAGNAAKQLLGPDVGPARRPTG
jgi:alkylhydroperoxidase family enzyme